MPNEPLLRVNCVTKVFPLAGGMFSGSQAFVQALDGVSFDVAQYQTLGIVGESGCGKTTLAKIIVKLIEPSSGRIDYHESLVKDFHRNVQIIFQNPFNSLNPRMRIFDIVAEPLLVHRIVDKKDILERAKLLLSKVELDESALQRYPAAFSGGQRQRICIARALASNPLFLVLDEPVSSLDLSIQARLLDLFIKIKKEFNLTYLFISHNLAVINYICDAVVVMQNGRIIEQGQTRSVFSHPKAAYTRSLLESAKG